MQPLLSGIANVKGRKKTFMQFFCYIGASSSAMLYYFDSNHIGAGILFFILAMIGFAGSIVFYNAFLPEITTEDRYDRVSARGFGMGSGRRLLLIFKSFFPYSQKLLMAEAHDLHLSGNSLGFGFWFW